MYHMSIV